LQPFCNLGDILLATLLLLDRKLIDESFVVNVYFLITYKIRSADF